MARAIGLEHTPSTVQYWKNADYLPRGRRGEVEKALCAAGMPQRKARRLVDQAVLGLTEGDPVS